MALVASAALAGGVPACTSTGAFTPVSGNGGGGSTAGCPPSGSLPNSLVSTGAAARIPVRRTSGLRYVPGQIAVTYRAGAETSALDVASSAVQAHRISDLAFDALGTRTRVVAVDPARSSQAMARFKAMPGVQSVSLVGYTSLQSIVTDDPYYAGFGAPGPYYETTTTPGQWDMHVIDVEGAWNEVASAPPVVAGAAPIAVIDTGVDVTHPELAGGKIVRTECFVTYPSNGAQSSGAYVTDTDGHGTNVAGIAAGDTDNGLGFVSADL